MSKERICKFERDHLAARVADNKYKSIIGEFETRLKKLGDKVYIRSYDAKVRLAMGALPEGFIDMHDSIRVSIGGRMHQINLTEERLIPNAFQYAPRIALETGDALGESIIAVEAALKTAKAERGTAEHLARQVLVRFTTYNSLIKGWPEVKTIADEYFDGVPQGTMNLPALNMDEVNRKLGLAR